jgi:hypothetical protein
LASNFFFLPPGVPSSASLFFFPFLGFSSSDSSESELDSFFLLLSFTGDAFLVGSSSSELESEEPSAAFFFCTGVLLAAAGVPLLFLGASSSLLSESELDSAGLLTCGVCFLAGEATFF